MSDAFSQTVPASALERLEAGQPFPWRDVELDVVRQRARRIAQQIVDTPVEQHATRLRLLASLFGKLGDDPDFDTPIFAEFGRYMRAGDRLRVASGCTFIDAGPISIGDDVRIDSGAHLEAVARPRDAEHRRQGIARAAPITIGDRAWIGARAIIGPGVTIGEEAIIAPGSVVLLDVPDGAYAAGNPCSIR